MSFLKKHTEIILVILSVSFHSSRSHNIINLPLINQLKDKKKVELKIHNLWDFLNAFFSEIIRVMSRFIALSYYSAVIIILFGILVMLIGYALFRTTKYDYDISIFIFNFLTQCTVLGNYLYYSFYNSQATLYIKMNLMFNRKSHYLWIIFSYGISY